MDVALAIDGIVPGAEYIGTFEENTEEEYNNITWNDSRDKPTWAEIVSKDATLQLEIAKYEQKELIRENFLVDTLQPVEVVDENGDDTVWNGGFDSAMRLDAALRLTQKLEGYTTCIIHDYFNVSHEYTFSGVDIVTVAIGGAYQQKFGKKEALLVQIDDADTIDEVQQIVW
jgi:hypothetical protein